jgi:hypothetical protein
MTAHASHSLTLGECQQKKKKTTKKNNNRVNAMGWRGGQRERERGGGEREMSYNSRSHRERNNTVMQIYN